MKFFKNGFTIAEMLVCFTVIGILASLLIPSIIHNRPNKSMSGVRKAYQITERTVAELIADEDFFPAEAGGSKSFAYYDPEVAADSIEGRTKKNTGKHFCLKFSEKLNTNGEIKCNTSGANSSIKLLTSLNGNGDPSVSSLVSFRTNDGIYWYVSPTIICDPEVEGEPCSNYLEGNELPDCPTDVGVARPYICVGVDVNGPESPNHMVSFSNNDVSRADRTWFYVYWNGKVVAPKGQTHRYLNKTDVFGK